MIPPERPLKELSGLRDDDDPGGTPKGMDCSCRRLPRTRAVITEAVQKLGENHFACYDLVGITVVRGCRGLFV